eukprot:CAMPEP_0171398120 /NCGR_PEP_ID=MMETSP0880-20121228/5709_1 /TAXON_ID=67004 /ORGANISM="Thalassiosira weissflogii, Strain CCMP1336" /LENGTH=34 /DNA_ID= /DNA_START= /DNA_END= /DNA_ORIENTATION=
MLAKQRYPSEDTPRKKPIFFLAIVSLCVYTTFEG